jgi:hypothetical protein
LPLDIPRCSLAVQPKFASLSSYEDGRTGGGWSPRPIKLLGELKNAGTFFAHSLVF